MLFYLWRALPLPEWLRRDIMWLGNTHFVAGASALIQDEQRRIMLFKHTYRRQHPWGLPGGWIGRGERPEEALVRELREEGGLHIVVERIATVDVDVRYRHFDLLYHCRIAGGSFRPSVEVSACAYFTLDALPDMMPHQKRQILRVVSYEL